MTRSTASVPEASATLRKPAAPRVLSRPPRIHGLDSLRAVAVAAVVVFHLRPGLLPGGFIGVDVFFVLSGFLITTLLVRERVQTGRVSLSHFWNRRVRRLIPAMVTTVLVCTAVAGVLGGDVLVGIKAQMFGALTFASNWVYIAQDASYSADLSPQLFANFWSLAVEEQFYLFWPLVVLAVFTIRRSRTAGLQLTGAAAVGSALWMALAYDPLVDPSRVYFGTDTHLFGLMAGAFFALWFAPRAPREEPGPDELAVGALLPWSGPIAGWLTIDRRRWLRLGLGGVSTVGLCVLAVTLSIDAEFTYRGGLVLASLCSVGLIAFLVRSQALARRVEVRPLRWVGVRSYGIYLWHWPALVLVAAALGADNPGSGTSSWTVAGVALPLSLLAAAASYRFLERPVMTRGLRAVGGRALARLSALLPWRRPAGSTARRIGAWSRFALVAVAVACVACAVTAAFVRAPAMSSLEAEIRDGAAAAAKARAEATVTPTVPPTVEPTESGPTAPALPPGPPPGDQVTVIGDSVTLISVDALQTVSPGIFVDAEVSRQMSSTPEIAAGLRDQQVLRPYVVLSLGTNSTVTEQVMDDAIAGIGPDHMIVLVTGYADRPWVDPTNDQMRAAAERYPNVVVADWQAVAAEHPDAFAKDGVHPKAPGQELYAQTIQNALVDAQAHELSGAARGVAGVAGVT